MPFFQYISWKLPQVDNKYFDNYNNYTKKERLGIIILLALVISLIMFPFFLGSFVKQPTTDHQSFEKELAELKIKTSDSLINNGDYTYDASNPASYYEPSKKNYYDSKLKAVLFEFDPNSLSADGWIKLGLREKTAMTIRKYVDKGGRFYKPEDIKKIWGLQPEDAEKLMPYVRIAAKPTNSYKSNDYNFTNRYPDEAKPSPTLIDINTADTAAFISLRGIGSRLANRIITFREKLGGFYSIDQVAETYALPDSTFQKIKSRLTLSESSFKKININTATLDELKSHPYIRYAIANALVQYRTQHGAYTSIADIKNIVLINDEVYRKMEPYLAIK